MWDKKVGQLKSLFTNGEGMHIGMALVHENGTASLKKDGLFIEGIKDGKNYFFMNQENEAEQVAKIFQNLGAEKKPGHANG